MRRRITLRNRWTAAFSVTLAVLIIPLGLINSLAVMSSGGFLGWGERLAFPLGAAFFFWLLLKPTFFSRIEIRGGKIIVKDFFAKKEIPVRLVQEARSGETVEVVLESGERHWCIHFLPSVAGALVGFPTHRRCAETLNRYLKEKKAQYLGEEHGTAVRQSPHLNLLFLTVLSTVFLALAMLF